MDLDYFAEQASNSSPGFWPLLELSFVLELHKEIFVPGYQKGYFLTAKGKANLKEYP